MTEYWKSQARKYCEFCKCWFADNKVSISFHDNGKRHKENVQKHISQLTKKSAKDFKHKGKIDDDIRKMEAAAMAAYLKDVQNNADLTSQNINKIIGESSKEDAPALVVGETKKTKSPPSWKEVKNDDGSSYYWNTVTNETTWDAPEEYISLADQEKKKLAKEKAKDNLKKEKQAEAVKEVKAHIAREQMRSRAAAPDPPPPLYMGPAPRPENPYGAWKPVEHKPVETVDLQLPKVAAAAPPPVVMEPERVNFAEKRVESLGGGDVAFKKRKIHNAKRNIRQKLDDD